jgi:hypothetical protein
MHLCNACGQPGTRYLSGITECDPCRKAREASQNAARLASGDPSACPECGGVFVVADDGRQLGCMSCHAMLDRSQPSNSPAEDPVASLKPSTPLSPPQSVHTCTACGEPLDPALVEAGFTTHGEDAGGEPPCQHEECWDALAGRCLQVVAS